MRLVDPVRKNRRRIRVQLRDTAVLGRVENVDAVDLVQIQDVHVPGHAAVRGAHVKPDLVDVGRMPECIPLDEGIDVFWRQVHLRGVELAYRMLG